jgi:hypothetical protein
MTFFDAFHPYETFCSTMIIAQDCIKSIQWRESLTLIPTLEKIFRRQRRTIKHIPRQAQNHGAVPQCYHHQPKFICCLDPVLDFACTRGARCTHGNSPRSSRRDQSCLLSRFDDNQWHPASLPVSLGGLGLRSAKRHSIAAILISLAHTKPLVAKMV